jgi:energy-coupling factor transporter ATP-binding protein EcfA2
MLSRAHVVALATGDGWIDRGGTILLFGPSGSGKSHLSAAFGHALIENGYRVLFTRTTDLVQRLQQARQALALESAIEKLDKYHLLILEDLCYVRKDQAETSVLFRLIAARYERRSLIVTSDHPFGEWTSVFPDAAMTLAAVDRLVHHSTILDTAGTQSLCLAPFSRSTLTTSASTAIQSIDGHVESHKKCLPFNAATSKIVRRYRKALWFRFAGGLQRTLGTISDKRRCRAAPSPLDPPVRH